MDDIKLNKRTILDREFIFNIFSSEGFPINVDRCFDTIDIHDQNVEKGVEKASNDEKERL